MLNYIFQDMIMKFEGHHQKLETEVKSEKIC